MRAILIQTGSGADKAANIAEINAHLTAALQTNPHPDLISLPEMWSCLGADRATKLAQSEPLPPPGEAPAPDSAPGTAPGTAYAFLQQMARTLRATVHGGSIGERVGDQLFNTSLVFGPDGQELARYRKIHLFDVTTPSGQGYRESSLFGAGEKIVTCPIPLPPSCSLPPTNLPLPPFAGEGRGPSRSDGKGEGSHRTENDVKNASPPPLREGTGWGMPGVPPPDSPHRPSAMRGTPPVTEGCVNSLAPAGRAGVAAPNPPQTDAPTHLPKHHSPQSHATQSQATLGLSICYDLRFAELFLALRRAGAHIIMVPAAFTVETGRDHWEVLLRARAIETQCWVIAAATTGTHYDAAGRARETYGHSLVADPWGRITAMAGHDPGFLACDIDLGIVTKVRENMPVLDHRRLA